MNSKILNGKVVHTRLQPLRHGFKTGVGFVAVDLEDLEEINSRVKGFGINRFAPVSLNAKNYLAPGTENFRQKVQPWVDQLQQDGAPEKIILVTSPAWWGKVFNPVSFYLIYTSGGKLTGLIAEVNNTFGDRHIYPVPLEKQEGIGQGLHPKEFHVSPFNNMEGNYRFTVRVQGDELYIGVDLFRDGKKILETWIEGKGETLDSHSLWRHFLRHPLRSWLTLPAITWQAVLLRFRHKLSVFKRPDPEHPHSLLSRHHPRI